MPTHFLTATDFSKQELLSLFKEARKLEETPDHQIFSTPVPRSPYPAPKILATVFLEPSTRTRLSFETAWIRGGGQFISIPNLETSSMNKGETLEDTGQIISTFADIIAIRTPNKGDVEKFATHATVPVINAGDGTGEHPTQHLLDLYTIWKEKGTLDGLTIGLMGDCTHSRVLRGMAKMLALFNVNLIFIAPEELQISADIMEHLVRQIKYPPPAKAKPPSVDGEEVPRLSSGRRGSKSSPLPFRRTENLQEVIHELDVLELNRVRHEYFEDKERALKIGECFRLSTDDLKDLKKDAMLLDPLPRINTYSTDVDTLPQAKYFDAVKNGVPIRMALMKHLLKSHINRKNLPKR